MLVLFLLGSCGGNDGAASEVPTAQPSAVSNATAPGSSSTTAPAVGTAADGTALYPEDYEQIARFWLKQYVEEQVPVLANPAADDWTKVNALREWAYGFIDSAAPVCLLDNDYGAQISQKLAFVMELLLENRGGFACGGTANVLTGLYRLFGYTSYAYNMGQLEGSWTHVVSLVQIMVDGRSVLSVQDAFLGFTLKEDGQPLDFSRLLDLLGSRQADRVEIASTKQMCKPAALPAASPGAVEELGKYYTISYLGTDGRVTEYCYDLNLKTLATGPEYVQAIANRTGQANFLYIFLLPLGTSGEAPAEALAAHAKEELARLKAMP
ncbi:MAG: hypothetical protein HYX53_12690 [Chloroflexi bacterium]|nr:hypothetical protein [Chloroflexota bacterium]